MTFVTIALLLGLAVLVSGFPRPAGHGAGIFRDTSGVQGLYGFRNSGNLNFGQWGSPHNGGSSLLVNSLGNINGRGHSIGNRANLNYGPGIFRHHIGGVGYSNFGNLDFGHTGRHSDGLNIGGSFVSDRSFGNFNRNGISSANRANRYDVSGSAVNGHPGQVYGDIFRHFGRDGIELGGYLAFE
ncbi:hypothetical protein ACJMK2_009116 [Sinanodonta woodiana]|uniref:Uncharacterized protein n=1 Tax=Sinanodonta woodiana TaxID=1069815 RepID=A0ABD3VBB7_SINWO